MIVSGKAGESSVILEGYPCQIKPFPLDAAHRKHALRSGLGESGIFGENES
jgi:hypothetical protein